MLGTVGLRGYVRHDAHSRCARLAPEFSILCVIRSCWSILAMILAAPGAAHAPGIGPTTSITTVAIRVSFLLQFSSTNRNPKAVQL